MADGSSRGGGIVSELRGSSAIQEQRIELGVFLFRLRRREQWRGRRIEPGSERRKLECTWLLD